MFGKLNALKNKINKFTSNFNVTVFCSADEHQAEQVNNLVLKIEENV